jgi:NPCBM/NEW2 domain
VIDTFDFMVRAWDFVRRWIVGLAAALVLESVCVGQGFNLPRDPRQVENLPHKANDFILHLADGRDVDGPFVELGVAWSIALGDGVQSTKASGSDWLTLRRRRVPVAPSGEQVVLNNGDRLPGTITRLVGDEVLLRKCLGGDQDLLIPVSALSLLWIAPPEGVEHPRPTPRSLAAVRYKRDRALLRNTDSVDGVLVGFDRDKTLRMRADKEVLDVDFRRVSAVSFSADLTRTHRPATRYGRVVLDDGTRISLSQASADQVFLRGRTLYGRDVKIPLDHVIAITLHGGSATYLSDLAPAKYEFTPYLGTLRWPYTKDTNVDGGDLVLHGDAFEKGIGMHSASRLTYKLERTYRYFEAHVGLNDDSGRGGSASVQLLVDGKPRLPAELQIAAEQAPRFIRQDVRDAKELTLVVGFGRYTDVRSRVNWADARLIK